MFHASTKKREEASSINQNRTSATEILGPDRGAGGC